MAKCSTSVATLSRLVASIVLEALLGQSAVALQTNDGLTRLYADFVKSSAVITVQDKDGLSESFLAGGEFSDATAIVGVRLKPTAGEWMRKFPQSSGESWHSRPPRVDELNIVIATGASASYSPIDYSMLEVFDRLHLLPNLDSLSLAYCPVSDELLPRIPGRSLVTLNLASTDITDRSGKTIAQLPKLRELDAGDTVTADEFLRAIRLQRQLRKLVLGGTKITDEAAATIHELENLEILRVHCTAVGDKFVREIKSMTSLRFIDLSDTSITDTGARYLTEVASLESLDLNKTPVTLETVRKLLTLPNLRHLGIKESNVTIDEVNQLRRDFSAIEIGH